MNGQDVRAPVAAGDILAGKYRVDRLLGVGGMGIVVAATHEELDQKVAIKFLQPEMSTNADLVRRFLREGRSAGKLKSEHIAKVLDVARLEDGSPYMVLEYLEGRDLGAVLDELGALPTAVAVQYILQAIEAIAEAHAAKIVHRDLKPQNLFLTHRVNGSALVKVLDFGISKALEESGEQMALTRSQSLLGSPLYMSPEQIRSSRTVDERTDIWSLGVLLHELLTGRHPFESDSIPGLVFQVTMENPTPVRAHREEVDAGLEAIIARCLAKNVDERYANVAELAKDLEPYGGDSAKGMAASIAAVLRAPTRASFASLPDGVAVHDPLAPTLDAKSDPDIARALDESTSQARASAARRGAGASPAVGAVSSAGDSGVNLATSGEAPAAATTSTARPAWQYMAVAAGLVGLGVAGALAATSRPGSLAVAPGPSGPPASLTQGAPATVAAGGWSGPAPAPAASASQAAPATSVTARVSATAKPRGKPGAPTPMANASAAPAAQPPAPQPQAPAPPPVAKATAKPTPSGPPGFVPYGE